MNPEPTHFVEQIRVRHSLLVDKKFLEGLTSEEADELTQINRFLDAAEEKYYDPIKKTLAAIKRKIMTTKYGTHL